jgi:hypothetical protein
VGGTRVAISWLLLRTQVSVRTSEHALAVPWCRAYKRAPVRRRRRLTESVHHVREIMKPAWANMIVM